MANYESLHNHTTDSDGDLSPIELLRLAEEKGFGIMALTEHDSVPTAERLAELRAYDGPVKWLIGSEISSGTPKELGGEPLSMLHILGLFIDITNESLLQHLHKIVRARQERMETLVKNLHGLGLTITAEECLELSGGEIVGRPHIVKALVSHPENLPVIEELRRRMETAAAAPDAAPQLRERYEDMMRTTAELEERQRQTPDDKSIITIWQQPFTLFLSDEAFIPGIFVDYTYWADLDQTVKLIRDAGGVAIIAHWPLVAGKISFEKLTELVKTGRIDGIEISSGFMQANMPETVAQLKQLAAETGCLATIGLDFHHVTEFDGFLEQDGLAEQTVGQTQRLIDRLRPDLTYSNF